MDYALFNAPIELSQYKHSVRNLNWDVEYTDRNRKYVDRFMVQYERAEMTNRARQKAKAVNKRRRKAVFF